MRVGGGWDNIQFTALVSVHIPEQIPLQFLLLQLLEVAGIPKKKIIRMILTGSPFVIVVLIFVLKLVYFELQDAYIKLGSMMRWSIVFFKITHMFFLVTNL
jgi:hypothetical protein